MDKRVERLTVAGSLSFGDEGMAAVGKLTRLKEFRTWHAGATQEGVKHLKNLTNLKNLNLGQRLTYKAPACPTDETLAILAEMPLLESLQLSEARLTLAALTHLKQLPQLKVLILDGIDIQEADVERLRKDLPKVDIKWTKPSDAYMKRIQALFGRQVIRRLRPGSSHLQSFRRQMESMPAPISSLFSCFRGGTFSK